MNLVATLDTFVKPLRLYDQAVGDLATALSAFEQRVYKDSTFPVSVHGHVSRALFELNEAFAAACRAHGLRQFSAVAYEEAKRFIIALPSRLAMPETAITPDGDVALEWDTGVNRNLTVLFEGTNTLIYSARFGANDRDFGRKTFNDVVPTTILEFINRICADQRKCLSNSG